MPLNIVRFQSGEKIAWGLLTGSQIAPLDLPCSTTHELLVEGVSPIKAAAQLATDSIDVGSVKLLSPITSPAKVLCQGANYRQHMIDSGMDPDANQQHLSLTPTATSSSPRTLNCSITK